MMKKWHKNIVDCKVIYPQPSLCMCVFLLQSIQPLPVSGIMDAIRKKMQSLKSETDSLYKTIAGFENETKEATARAEQVKDIIFYQSYFVCIG